MFNTRWLNASHLFLLVMKFCLVDGAAVGKHGEPYRAVANQQNRANFNSTKLRTSFPHSSLPTATRTIGEDCGKCGIEAPGGVRLIYWAPDEEGEDAPYAEGGANEVTLVEDGFTLCVTSSSAFHVSNYSTARHPPFTLSTHLSERQSLVARR